MFHGSFYQMADKQGILLLNLDKELAECWGLKLLTLQIGRQKGLSSLYRKLGSVVNKKRSISEI